MIFRSKEVLISLVREAAIESISRLPEGCTIEDTVYRIGLIARVFEGLKDAKAGRLITTDELFERVDQWAG
ncbi:MAG: hypothetical protein JRJ29_13575 [Deltaproteobacteria bacterium]|nr:hypothetical protein [Deltaproteobacteria bacterium]